MAVLQKLLEIHSITVAGKEFRGKLFGGSCRLRCWLDGATVPDDPTVIDRVVSAPYESMEGSSIDEQLMLWGKKIKEQAQYIIDSYNLEQTLKNNEKVGIAVTAVQNQLTG